MPGLALERHTLDNGLRVVLHRDSSLPLVAVNLWYHVGSKNEVPGRTGFAHLFEHMLFQGSEHVGPNQHMRYVQQIGGSPNGSTWYDRTSYYQTLPAHELELGLWLESDRMGFMVPALTQENLDRQRQVVLNERRQRVENRPYGTAYERLYELLFPPGHPYRWPVIGYVEDLAAAELADFRAFFQTHYVPSNAVLTLAGDFEPAEALDRVHAYFGPLPAGETLAPVTVTPPRLENTRRAVVEDKIQLPRIYLGFHIPAYGEPMWYAANLLSSTLTQGKSSLLHRDLVYRRQLALDVSSFVLPLELGSVFTLVVTCKPGSAPQAVEAHVLEHLRKLADEPLSEPQLERCRNQVLIEYHRNLQTLNLKSDSLSMVTTYFDDPGFLAREAQLYQDLTAEDLKTFAARYLCAAKAVVTFVPTAGKEGP